MTREADRSGAKVVPSLPPRSRLNELERPSQFIWATGIEDTFIVDPHARTGRALDEYDLTDHYARVTDDLGLVASLGVSAARYGLPWYRINPARDEWDWSFADAALNRLMDLGVDPIVDLVHYGTPAWLAGGFLDPDFPRAMAAYGRAVAERYRGRIRWYTPMNEPRITAWYCGRVGHWPPYARGWGGFARIMVAAARGIVETQRAMQEVDPEIVACHVDASDLYVSDEPQFQPAADFRQSLVFLALDLVTGRVDPSHSLHRWLLDRGISPIELDWLVANPVALDVVGINLYPMFTQKVAVGDPTRVRWKMKYANGPLLERLGRMYAERYGRPVMVTETASNGTVARRKRWMDDSIAACRQLRAEGVPLIGYTWWPLFSLVAWSYRNSIHPMERHLVHLGLWDLDERLDRQPTPLVSAYQSVITQGAPGLLEAKETEAIHV